MKIRESGMPDQNMWEKFFDAEKILTALGFDNQINDVAEFGCGYGTFTIPIAKVIKGKIYALDIDPKMVQTTKEKAKNYKLDNVVTELHDFMAVESGLEDNSVDYVTLFNILHLERPKDLLREAIRILKENGKLGIIHWNNDSSTPRGPSMEIRPKLEQCIERALDVGFTNPVRHDLKPYHYGIVLIKKRTTK
jgi:ubiquinone/menaquinone biosynthesis C-methylase UbiE